MSREGLVFNQPPVSQSPRAKCGLMFFHLYKTSWNSCTYCGNRQVHEFITDFLFITIHLRHVENGDDTEQAYKFEHQVEVLQWVALRGGGSDLWWKCQNKIHHEKPEGHQRHKVVELVGAVHTQAQCDCHEVQSEQNLPQETHNNVVMSCCCLLKHRNPYFTCKHPHGMHTVLMYSVTSVHTITCFMK